MWTQLFCTPALFFWSVSENFHFVALFTILPASRVSLLSWRELFAHGHAHLGSQRPLGFCHRSESCKFISEPNPVLISFLSITLWLSPFLSSSSLHLGCNVFVCLFCNISAHWPHWHLAKKCIPLCLRWLYFQWGFYWDRALHPELGCAPAGLREERPFSQDFQACDHLICRHECWGIHTKLREMPIKDEQTFCLQDWSFWREAGKYVGDWLNFNSSQTF